MSCISWNCQGLGAPLTRKVLNDTCRRYKLSLVFLMETRMKEARLERVRRRVFGDGCCVYVDPVGSSGGLALWWKKGMQIDILDVAKNFINVNLSKGPDNSWGVISFIYGAPRE